MKDNVANFTGRVEEYAKCRPGYPEQIISLLENKIGFDQSKDIADIGCGTGKLSRVFLNNGNLVFGVEPNEEMRKMAETLLNKFINFISVEGTAETTMLATNSVDVITVGQAFHWFDLKKAKKEFKRILRKDGCVVIVWNERNNNTQVMKAVNRILLSLNQEHEEAEKNLVDKNLLSAFFGVDKVGKSTFPNYQMLDLAGLKGRIHSISYVPDSGSENKRVMNEVKDVFEKFNNGGQVKIEYTTRVFWGNIK
ncbi:MAG: class I SAM-dependent methyltransferase [Ignavibacteriae bacterium]|nr:class I SAM-dependent methyltransferase [Ignavibacteriota bacterium]